MFRDELDREVVEEPGGRESEPSQVETRRL